VAVPQDTRAVIQKLEDAFLEIARNPESRRNEKQGFVPVAMGHKESKPYIEKTAAIFKNWWPI